YLDLASTAGARSAMAFLDTTLEKIAQERGAIGAFQSRLDVAERNLEALRSGSLLALSRITDADIAADSAELVRHQILQQATTAILAQANQQPRVVLTLLSERS